MSSMLIALINLFYKVSFHLAAMTLLIIVAAYVWGQVFLVLLVVLPLVAWAKYQIHDHSIPQLLMGIVIGVTVSLMTLYLLD
ncbi:MAG: hypothetical protein LUQ65_05715 [Candidatus Helarchaeota archaeon]|nr:hypothetical protein [Candidatus Helarchaeota archaeon]